MQHSAEAAPRVSTAAEPHQGDARPGEQPDSLPLLAP